MSILHARDKSPTASMSLQAKEHAAVAYGPSDTIDNSMNFNSLEVQSGYINDFYR